MLIRRRTSEYEAPVNRHPLARKIAVAHHHLIQGLDLYSFPHYNGNWYGADLFGIAKLRHKLDKKDRGHRSSIIFVVSQIVNAK